MLSESFCLLAVNTNTLAPVSPTGVWLDEEDEEYADYGGVTTPSEGRRARVQVGSEMTKEEKDDEDGEDAPPPLPTRRRGGGSTRSAPPSPPKTSIADRVLFSGILERKSNSMFSSSWKQQWVRGVRARLNRKSEHKPTLSKTQVQLTGE